MRPSESMDAPGDTSRAVSPTLNEDDRELEALGYVPSFRREFSNLATVSAHAVAGRRWLRFECCF
jgi:hypothetical protein